MIEFIHTNRQTRYSDFSNELMVSSFPECERPPLADLGMRNPTLFHACTIMMNGTPVGLFNYWTFEDFDYIEHFAVDPKLRNNGIGVQAIQEFLKGRNRTVVLEAELPTDDLSQRRIRFYQRNGFVVNPQPYTQPAYRPLGETLEMAILSTLPLDDGLFDLVKSNLYKFVYNQKPMV